MKIKLDKIASATKNIPLKEEVEITSKVTGEEGAVLAVEVMDDKQIYNKLELTSGRLSTLKKGDQLAVALGNRQALKGFVGHVPKELKQGDVINLLNLGGVAGICTSRNLKAVGEPLKIKVLGAIKGKSPQKPLNIHDYKLFGTSKKLNNKIPLIIVSGTTMEIGKTSVACDIIKYAVAENHIVCGAKLAGIAAIRDTANMEDHGAISAVSIVDAGYTSTVEIDNTAEITKGAINFLAKNNPEYIVLELGDGIFGHYGVINVLKDKQIQKNIFAHVGCAFDPPGAIKLYETCNEIGAPLHMVSGPITDNSVGKTYIKEHLNIKALNGLTEGKKIFPYLKTHCKITKK